MKKIISKYKRVILYILLLVFICTDLVYAKTTGEIKFCDYGGVQRTLKIIGVIIAIMKIVAPLIIIITTFFISLKPVISGTVDDFKGSLKTLMMKIVSGLIIFGIPSMLDYTFENLIGAKILHSINAVTAYLMLVVINQQIKFLSTLHQIKINY